MIIGRSYSFRGIIICGTPSRFFPNPYVFVPIYGSLKASRKLALIFQSRRAPRTTHPDPVYHPADTYRSSIYIHLSYIARRADLLAKEKMSGTTSSQFLLSSGVQSVRQPAQPSNIHNTTQPVNRTIMPAVAHISRREQRVHAVPAQVADVEHVPGGVMLEGEDLGARMDGV